MTNLLLVCLGGALGSGLRYAVSLWAGPPSEKGLPIATLAVNLLGCFLMGFVMEFWGRMGHLPESIRLALTTGFLGGLTTYSALNFETLRLWGTGAGFTAALYLISTLLFCLLSGHSGTVIARTAVSLWLLR